MDTNGKKDETESNGGLMIRLDLREFEIAPEFAHLKDAPVADFETCTELLPMKKKGGSDLQS